MNVPPFHNSIGMLVAKPETVPLIAPSYTVPESVTFAVDGEETLAIVAVSAPDRFGVTRTKIVAVVAPFTGTSVSEFVKPDPLCCESNT